jgi:hypothetical protein
MSLLNTLLWWQWAVLFAVPLGIILLYFLKLRRQPVEVPSTYLWSRTIEDLHVNSIWQRLRQNLLLFLQLLFIALLILALLRPGWKGNQLIGDRFIFLIDNSASMNAVDIEPSRLEWAKQKAIEMVDQMDQGDVAMVISFSDSARVVQTFTDSRRTLRRKIADIQPTYRGTNLREALRAAGGLANPGFTRLADEQVVDESLPATLYVLSDGRFPSVPEYSLGHLEPQYISVGSEAASNRGIVAFAVERNPERPTQLQAFANVANWSEEAATVQLELSLNGESFDLVELEVPPNDTAGWNFDLPDVDQAILKVQMTPDDLMESDNVAHAVVNRPRLANVLLVTSGNTPLRLAMDTKQSREMVDLSVAEPGIVNDDSYQSAAATGAYDLIIFDRCSPLEMPQANTLFINALPPGDRWTATASEFAPYVIDIDRIHPLTHLVDMSNVKIASGMVLDPPVGSAVLFDSVNGPLFAVAPRAGYEDAVLGFALLTEEEGETVPNTTWPLRRSFPVFVYNVLRYLGGHQVFSQVASIEPGSPATILPRTETTEVTVVGPSGERQRPVRSGTRAMVVAETENPGIYEVYEQNESDPSSLFAVNLLSQLESNIAPTPSLELGYEQVDQVSETRTTRRELWKWLLFGALLLLMFEWYVFNRRVYL